MVGHSAGNAVRAKKFGIAYRPCPKFARHKRSHFIPAARLDRCDWQSCVLPRPHTARYGIGVWVAQIPQDVGCDQTAISAAQKNSSSDCLTACPTSHRVNSDEATATLKIEPYAPTPEG